VLFTASAVLLATSRSLGPIFLVLLVACAVSLTGLPEFARHKRAWITVGVVALLASLSTVVWEIWAQPGVPNDWSYAFDQLRPALSDVTRTMKESVGVFGVTNNVKLPIVVVLGWFVGLALLVGSALIGGRRRDRLTLAATVVAAPLSIIALSVLVLRQAGFGIQGRHVLAVLVLVPLSAAYIINRRRLVAPSVVLAAAVFAVAANVIAVWVNARHYKTHGSLLTDFGSMKWPFLVGCAGLWLIGTIIRAAGWPRAELNRAPAG
jgi:hypothetical protein